MAGIKPHENFPLKDEASSQSDIQSALEQVFIKDVSVHSCVHLTLNIPIPAAEKHACFMMLPAIFHYGDGIDKLLGGCHVPFTEGVAFVWPLFHIGLISGALQR